MKYLYVLLVIACITGILASCEKITPAIPQDDELLDGPVEGLTTTQHLVFLKGDVAFNDEIFTAEKGLGPYFVATSCGSCHAGDGKGHPFTTLTRFGQTDSSGNLFLEHGGPQLQNRSIPGFNPEQIPAGATFSKFTPPANTGLGFIELVPDADILSMADPSDMDGDGISGVPNWNKVPSFIIPYNNAITQNGKYICRFGKKAGTYNLFQQTVTAYNQDIGITSTFLPNNPVNPLDGTHPVPSGGPEVTDEAVNAVVFYLQTLKAPIQRTPDNGEVTQGKNIFISTGCEKCHKETLKTGYSPVEALSYKEFHPYTDLLLHDMGSNLDDGYTEGSALTNEWRTPPLWGLGLSHNSQGGQYYLMHDGRAGSFEEAILLHGGEAENSKVKFQQLSENDKNALLKFLESL
ncbi:MAG TPA: di-heme oxidoredictase family protein [Bacteroidia bacterium]|nr:di-heme oxidoredictase family protein [Bacteroidia bacterium]